MAHGTPVVAVAEGGVAETVQPGVTGYLVERDASQFALCVEGLLRNQLSLEAMRGNARAEVVSQWDVARRTAALEELLLSTSGALRGTPS